MGTPLAVATVFKEAGIVVAALLAAVVVLAPAQRVRAWAMAAALVLTPVLLVAEIWNTSQFHPIRHHPALAGVGLVFVLVALAVAAWVFDRWPALFPLAAVLVLPFRIPIESGGQTANLLVPLYFVVAGGGLAFVRRRLRAGGGEAPEHGVLEWILLGFVVLYAIQASYSADFTKALEQVVFFYVPFALLYALLRAITWTRELAFRCLGVLVGLGLLFSLVGFAEYATRTVFLNPDVVASNQFQTYFRVNSLFFDPNIFGRFLTLVMLALVATMLWSPRRRTVGWAGAAVAVLFAGLVLTLSQSSLGALLVGLVVLAALRFNLRWTLAAVGAIAVVALVVVLAVPGAVKLNLGSGKSVDKATSGRVDLIKGGLRLFEHRPVAGWGTGSFSKEYRRHERVSSERAADASHTIPVTIAAEQGVLGLLVYLALLVAAFARLLPGARGDPIRAAIAAGFAALVFHTLLYAAFLEDPLSWTLLAVGSAFALQAARARAPSRRRQSVEPEPSPA
jgi:O-antigen ligase